MGGDDVATGEVITALHRRHRAVEFKKFLIRIDKEVPTHLQVHLIVDNYGTHKTPAIRAWLARHPRFELHFTPTGSSWINQVERWFGYLAHQMIRRGAHKNIIAAELGVSHGTVNRWRSRFIRLRLDGLTDEPRPGRPPAILLDQVENVLTATLESTPGKDTHWSRASMAKHSGLSRSTIGRIWKKFDLKPHLQDAFKLSTDPQFIAKVVDVVGLYYHPPEKAVVLCVDEKSQIQALDRSQPVLPMMPGMPERRTHDYYRHGITSLFAAFNIADGSVISELHRRHRAIEFKKFLVTIDKAVPAGLDVHLVCDNYATHNTAEIKTWLGKHPRFHVHFTPTGSSWMN